MHNTSLAVHNTSLVVHNASLVVHSATDRVHEALTSLLTLFTKIVVAGSAAWLGRGLSSVCAQSREDDSRQSFDLTPAQESLRALGKAAFPEEELHGLMTEQWKEMGWKGKDPSTDFRFTSLENLLYFARNFREGDRFMWEYPFAVAGVNITFMRIQMLMLDLEAVKPRNLVGATFLKFLSGKHNHWIFTNFFQTINNMFVDT
ncbi:putative ELMO domain-containing protein [Helianthus anomalus]